MSSALSHYAALRRHLKVVHHVPGRVRLRFTGPVKGVARSDAGVTAFLAKLQDAPPIRSVRLSPATLSAIIEYDPHALPKQAWETVLSGPEDAAVALLEAIAEGRHVA